MVRDCITVLPLVFSQLWQISLECASEGQNKWGTLITEASPIVISSPSLPHLFSWILLFLCFFPPFPLVSSQDMSNCHWSQTELLTSSVSELRSLKYTFCRITQTFACLVWSGNELRENSLVRSLALHGLKRVGKNTKMLFHGVFLCLENEQSYRSEPLKADVMIQILWLGGKKEYNLIFT